MKARNEWVRKKVKRETRQKKDRGIVDFVRIVKHFFKNLPQWIQEMEDPRCQSYITYSQEDLVFLGILKNACSVESMRQMEDMFNEENCIRTLALLSGDKGLDEMPHSDTLNYYLERLSPECLSELRTKMIKQLIHNKIGSSSKLLGKYWRVILDGTGLFYFKEKHCGSCLKEVHHADGKETVRYYHKVLEAKLVLGDGFLISLGTEFIENENEDVTKQDCELNAAKRLFGRIKKEYPKLAVCIQADALYEVEPVMKLCRENSWKYIFTHKDARQPAAGENYELLDSGDKTIVEGIGAERGTGEFYNGVNELAGKDEAMNFFGYRYKDISGSEKCFQWSTNIQITKSRLEELIVSGRGRWQIENQGFNIQKNLLYKIHHLNSHNANAMKNHYLLTQIADILLELYLKWNPMIKKLGQGIKNTSSRLLESLRQHTVTDEDVSYIKRRTSVYLE